MKNTLKNTMKIYGSLIILFLLCQMPFQAFGATYTIQRITKSVDGDTFCGGSACTSADTIIIEGGPRGSLRLQNFNGNGNYIVVKNDPGNKVVITNDNTVAFGVFSITDCKSLDIRGDNNADDYGIKIINSGGRSGNLWVYGESDHIKISYMEMSFDGNTTSSGIGIQVQSSYLTSAFTFDTFEIHHNYIHDSRYSGMYLGHNDPPGEDNPYAARFSVHDNIIENSGSYGMVLKGLNGGPNSIYNNTIDTTAVVSWPNSDEWRSGIRVRTYTQSYNVSVYNNFVMNTKGPGILAGLGANSIYNNIICNAGTNNDVDWGHGIVTYLDTTGTNIYDNIIIQPTRYGIYNKKSKTNGVTMSRNLIGNAGSGEWAEVESGDTIESGGVDANIYHADVADFHFTTWSDDGHYSNDIFKLSGSIAPPLELRLAD